MTVALLPPVILVLSGEAGHRHQTKTKTDWHDSQMNRDACASGRLGRMCSENPEVFIAGSLEALLEGTSEGNTELKEPDF